MNFDRSSPQLKAIIVVKNSGRNICEAQQK
jgi:hypothetical protein